MFLKISRYDGLTDHLALDAKGRSLLSKSLRRMPEVGGDFLHMVEEKDRLDHLAYTYYKEPRKWWRICDANSSFFSPLQLLGKESLNEGHFPVTYSNSDTTVLAPWYKLIKSLNGLTGVENLLFREQVDIEKQAVKYNRQAIAFVSYNRLVVTADDIGKSITQSDAGFSVGKHTHTGRLGKNIVIPTDVEG